MVNFLLYKYENLNLITQNTHNNMSMLLYTYNSSTEEAEIGRSLGQPGEPQVTVNDPVSKNTKALKKQYLAATYGLHWIRTHIHAYTPYTYINTCFQSYTYTYIHSHMCTVYSIYLSIYTYSSNIFKYICLCQNMLR